MKTQNLKNSFTISFYLFLFKFYGPLKEPKLIYDSQYNILSTVNLPVKNIGMDMKKPPTAQTRLTLDFCKYLLPL